MNQHSDHYDQRNFLMNPGRGSKNERRTPSLSAKRNLKKRFLQWYPLYILPNVKRLFSKEQLFLACFFTVVKTGQVLNRYFPRFEGWWVHAWIHLEQKWCFGNECRRFCGFSCMINDFLWENGLCMHSHWKKIEMCNAWLHLLNTGIINGFWIYARARIRGKM